MSHSLSRSTPSAHDVDSRGISAFIAALEGAANVEPHSLMIAHDGEVITEGWWAPYSAGRPHLLYSLSKSFTSSAVGFAVAEGLLSLDDTVISHFPELSAEITDERSRSMRVRHILSMASGHLDDTIHRVLAVDPENIVRGFLLTPPEEEPGTVFAYNQPCTYTAAAIVQRLTGVPLTEYLRPRLFEPLGIDPDHVGWLRDPSGNQLGFSGLHAPTEAVLALAEFYRLGGAWNGEQLLPSAWVADATRKHVSNGDDPASDWAQGYGFQFWVARHGYRGDGAYGQFCIVLPEQRMVVAITGQSDDMQAVLDLVWTHLLPAVGGRASDDTELAATLAALSLPPLAVGAAPRDIPADTTLHAAAGNDQPGVESIEVSLADDGRVVLTIVEKGERSGVVAGFDEWLTTGAVTASAGWAPAAGIASRLLVDLIFIETPHRLHLVLDLDGGVFVARWQTPPLHALRLSTLRKPAPDDRLDTSEV